MSYSSFWLVPVACLFYIVLILTCLLCNKNDDDDTLNDLVECVFPSKICNIFC